MVEIVTKLEDTKFDGRETRSSVIGSYLQATSLFLKKIHDNLNNNHTPQWSPEFKEALTLETHFVCVDNYIHLAWELMRKTQEILQTLNGES